MIPWTVRVQSTNSKASHSEVKLIESLFEAHHAALVQKQFVLNFMTSYMALTFTAFVYIPFGSILQPFLNFWGKTAQTLTMSEVPLTTRQFESNPQRIANQMYYTTVTAQIINTLTEVVVPYIKHKATVKAKELSSNGAVKSNDQPEEAEFLKRVRNQTGLEVYDVTADYREMVMQFGELRLCITFYHDGIALLTSNRLSLSVFRFMASYGLLFPSQQLDRAAIRCSEDCHWLSQTHPMASRLHWTVVDGPGLSFMARQRH